MKTYFISRVVARIVSAMGALTIVASIGFYLAITFSGNSIQAAMYRGPAGSILVGGIFAGLLILAFGLLCTAVFHIAQSASATKSG